MKHIRYLLPAIPCAFIFPWVGFQLDLAFNQACKLLTSYVPSNQQKAIYNVLFTSGEHAITILFGFQMLVLMFAIADSRMQGQLREEQLKHNRFDVLQLLFAYLSLALLSFLWLGMAYVTGLPTAIIVSLAIGAMDMLVINRRSVVPTSPNPNLLAYQKKTMRLEYINGAIQFYKKESSSFIAKMQHTTAQFILAGMIVPSIAIIIVEPGLDQVHPLLDMYGYILLLYLALVSEAHGFAYSILNIERALFYIQSWLHWLPFVVITALLTVYAFMTFGMNGFAAVACMIPHTLFAVIYRRKILGKRYIKTLLQARRTLKRELRREVRLHPELAEEG